MTTGTPPGLAVPRSIALRIITVLVALSTAVAFGESYRALYLWAAHHDVPAGWAFIWPAMVDVFVAVGELALFVGMTDQWATRHRVWAWTVTTGGLAVSVAGNIGHVGSAQWTDRITAAVPPLAAFVALTVGLGILKRVVERAIEPQSHAARVAIDYQPETLADMATQADRVRFAIGHLARSTNRAADAIKPQEIAAYLQDHADEIPSASIPSASYIADIIRRDLAARERAAGDKITHLPRDRQTA